MRIGFAASESTQAIVLYLFCMGRLFTDLYLIHFQTMSGNARAYMSSWLSHGDAGGQQDSHFEPFFYIIVRLWDMGACGIFGPKALGCGARAKRGCYKEPKGYGLRGPLLDTKPMRASARYSWRVMITARIAWPCAGDGSFKFLPYQLSMVGYWPTMVTTCVLGSSLFRP